MKFHIFTFGCQMNVHDSEWLSRALEIRGWRSVPEDEADVFIVNTCSVRDKPEQKVYSLLGRISRHLERNPDMFVAVGGCVAQQVGKVFFRRFPFVRLVFGTDQTQKVPEALDKLSREGSGRMILTDFLDHPVEREFNPPSDTLDTDTPGQAFVSIMQGCDNFCAYCIVPYVRGRQKSRPTDAVVDECRALVETGVREITLLGQNVNSFGLDRHGDGVSFAQLLRRVAGIPGLERVRFTTSHPKDLAPEVVAAFGEFENIAPHLHLPLQSGSDSVLRSMGRGYDLARYMSLVEGLKRVRPGIALTTDLIVGFPGETEDDFEATMRVVEEVGYEGSFSFIYSDRPGTRSVKMEPKVDPVEAGERLIRLQALQARLTAGHYQRLVGKMVQAQVEGRSKRPIVDGQPSWRGRDAHWRVVNFVMAGHAPEGEDLSAKIVPVKIGLAKKHSLLGEAEGDPW